MLNVNINLHGCWIHVLLNHKVKETAAKKFLLPEFDVAHLTGCFWNTRITDVALNIVLMQHHWTGNLDLSLIDPFAHSNCLCPYR